MYTLKYASHNRVGAASVHEISVSKRSNSTAKEADEASVEKDTDENSKQETESLQNEDDDDDESVDVRSNVMTGVCFLVVNH